MAAGVTEVFKNTASTTLNNGGTLTSGATSCTVTSGAVFPSTGNFRILIESEIILVTARATNVLTLTRGQEGTSAASHADGLAVTHILTAGAIQAVQQATPTFTNTASAAYSIDSTGNTFDVFILHNKSGAVTYTLPAPTAGRRIELEDITGAIQTQANWVFIAPNAGEKINTSAGFTLSGTAYHFTNGNATVTATSSKFQSELLPGMTIQSSNQSGVNYIVSSIASDTSLTLTTTFGGSTTTTATATRTSLTFAANFGRLVLRSDGTDWFIKGDGTPTKISYTASSGGTVLRFIPPAGTTGGWFTLAGGGGGGGSGGTVNSASGQSGGAGGGAAIEVNRFVGWTGNTANDVTIGAGGAGGTAVTATQTGNNGNPGGTSSVGSLISAGGASGGSGATSSTSTDQGGGLCVTNGDGTNLYGVVDTTTLIAAGNSFTSSIAQGGRSKAAVAGLAGASNPAGAFAGGGGGAVGGSTLGGGGGGGGAGPRGAGATGSAGKDNGTASATPSDAPGNSGAGGAGSGGASSFNGTNGAASAGGSGYIDIVYVL